MPARLLAIQTLVIPPSADRDGGGVESRKWWEEMLVDKITW